MPVLQNIGLLATPQSNKPQSEIIVIQNSAVVWQGGTIVWVGRQSDLPRQFSKEPTIDAEGCTAIPGLVDCHTHLAFAGWRADEFRRRILGESYLDIAKAGGGILSTVALTRQASKTELVQRARSFLSEMATLGVTTVEAKSGYGLTLNDEIKLLEVYAELGSQSPISIVPTFLGAHTIPAEFRTNREEYIRIIKEQMLPIVASKKLAKFCDIFVEESAFSPVEAHAILSGAKALGLQLKLHVDQLSNSHGAKLAADLGAVSADHLEHIDSEGIEALRQSGTVAVLLPLASLFTRQTPLDARALLAQGVHVAIATDFNPGSAPSYHLPLAMMLACTMSRMTPAETLSAATLIAAKAVKMEHEIGSIEPGKRADIALLEVEGIDNWMYHFRGNVCRKVFKNGQEIHVSGS